MFDYQRASGEGGEDMKRKTENKFTLVELTEGDTLSYYLLYGDEKVREKWITERIFKQIPRFVVRHNVSTRITDRLGFPEGIESCEKEMCLVTVSVDDTYKRIIMKKEEARKRGFEIASDWVGKGVPSFGYTREHIIQIKLEPVKVVVLVKKKGMKKKGAKQ